MSGKDNILSGYFILSWKLSISENIVLYNCALKHPKTIHLSKLPGGNANQATFMNKDQVHVANDPLNPYPGDAEQIKTYCLMQDVAGTSYLNSPTQIYIRIANVDKMEIVHNKIKMLVPLYIDDLNVSSAISTIQGNISTIQGDITTIQGDITNINTSVSDLDSNKQNNITLVAGANISITEDPADTFTIDSTGSNLLSGTNNISVFNSSINLSSNISTDNCSLKNLSADEICYRERFWDHLYGSFAVWV